MKPNTILAGYQILEQLSHKTSRQTFLARNLQSEELVVVKILHFDANCQWDYYKLFEREAKTLQNLQHPAIPKYLDYFDLEDGFALVQTYIDAPSLETVMKSGRKFSEVEVVELADRILSILTYLHEQLPPVIHRDIKPSNILLGNRSGNSIGDVYLVDFGSVQTAASTDGGTITIVGTAGYIPLEQFSGKTVIASDLYSLGMTVIYLLTGVHPTELTQVNGHFKFTAEISNRLYQWVDKMTQPYLDKRFDSAKLAQIALTSEDGNYGDLVHLKPANTQIKLYRDREKIEIIWEDIDREKTARIDAIAEIPSTLITILPLICLASFLLSLLLPWMAYLGSLAFFGIFFTIFIIWPISALFIHVAKEFINKVDYKLVIDDQYIYHYKSQSKHQTSKKISQDLRSEIGILAYNPGYVFDNCLSSDGKVISGSNITVPPKLYLYCNNVEYYCYARLSQAEFWWLGQELSDFLNLELQVIYPTPILPQVPSCGGGC
jgi:serine/threonine protein kinase